MSSIYHATLGISGSPVNLPLQFSYPMYMPKKRMSTTQTAGAVVIQTANSQIIHGDGSISWTCEACYPAEFSQFYTWYNTALPTLYVFKGYWGEVFDVIFAEFDPPKVRSRLFNLSGQFQVVSVTTEPSPDCWSP